MLDLHCQVPEIWKELSLLHAAQTVQLRSAADSLLWIFLYTVTAAAAAAAAATATTTTAAATTTTTTLLLSLSSSSTITTTNLLSLFTIIHLKQTNHVLRIYGSAVCSYHLFTIYATCKIIPMLNVLYFCISTFQRMCALPSRVGICSSLIS